MVCGGIAGSAAASQLQGAHVLHVLCDVHMHTKQNSKGTKYLILH